MKRTPVTSSSIKSIGHEGDTLHVEFASGKTYKYSSVSAEKHAALMAASSTGGHFSKHIRPHHTGVAI